MVSEESVRLRWRILATGSLLAFVALLSSMRPARDYVDE